jgi:hypothetical protein
MQFIQTVPSLPAECGQDFSLCGFPRFEQGPQTKGIENFLHFLRQNAKTFLNYSLELEKVLQSQFSA